MTCYEIWSLVIQSLVAVGTFLVAILALIIAIWGDRMRSWGFGPDLKLSLISPQGERNDLDDGSLCRNYHLRVTNTRKKAPAHNVQVFLTKIFRSSGVGSLVDKSFSGPLQLTWQFPENNPQTLLIGPDRVCDLGQMIKGKSFELMLYLTPNSFEHHVGPNERIRMELIAVGENGSSAPIFIEIFWNGKWNDDTIEMGHNLVVKEIIPDA
jgi:hypothetical protein